MPRRNWITILTIAAAVGLGSGWATAEEPEEARASRSTEDEKKSETAASPVAQQVMIASNMPVFVPPNRGAPPMRLGGATRSASKPVHALPRMEALVPEEPGWTLEAQPVLYWYLEETTDVPLEFGLQRVDPLAQVVKTKIARPTQAGIQHIDLADHGANLEPGQIYFWFVKAVPDPNNPEQDRIVGGGIRRVSAPAELTAELQEPGASRPHSLAKAGVWYDAIDSYSEAIEASPGDAGLQSQRAALLKQVDIELQTR